MKPVKTTIYRKGSILPPLPGHTLPNSSELFHVYEQTAGYDPILIVASSNGQTVAKLLAVIRQSNRFFPPSIIHRCEVFGTGEYFDKSFNQEDLFGIMLEHLTHEVKKKCFLIEFRNISTSLFGYKHFQKNNYFPINWIRVYNSLHSLPPEKRIESARNRQIKRSLKNGVIIQTAQTDKEISTFLQMLKRNYSVKFRKHFPDIHLFKLLTKHYPNQETAKIFLVKYKDKIIGGSFCMYSGDKAYLCFSGGMHKTYARLHPGAMSIWAAMTDAYQQGYQHFEFIDAGLPFQKVGYRNFILSFGGKQVSTRRWFRFRWRWLNRLLIWLYQ